MSNRELAIEIVQQLPADTPLREIAREIELRAGIEAARAQVRRGEGQPVEQVRKLVDLWASPSSYQPWLFERRLMPLAPGFTAR